MRSLEVDGSIPEYVVVVCGQECRYLTVDETRRAQASKGGDDDDPEGRGVRDVLGCRPRDLHRKGVWRAVQPQVAEGGGSRLSRLEPGPVPDEPMPAGAS